MFQPPSTFHQSVVNLHNYENAIRVLKLFYFYPTCSKAWLKLQPILSTIGQPMQPSAATIVVIDVVTTVAMSDDSPSTTYGPF